MKVMLALSTLLLAGCDMSGPAVNKAEQLDNVAEQSTPGSARVLENAADRIRAGDDRDAEAEGQRALNEAANVAATER
jgi:hypothetical protein